MDTGQKNSGTVTALATLAFVFGLLGLLGSLIPCIGALAFYLGIPGAIIAVVAYLLAKAQNATNTFVIVALVISLLGVTISAYQFFSIKSAGERSRQKTLEMMR